MRGGAAGLAAPREPARDSWGLTILRCRQAPRRTLRFTTWLHFLRVLPSAAEDWDDVVVEYLNAVDLSFEDLGVLLASIELFFPKYKGELRWSRAATETGGLRST